MHDRFGEPCGVILYANSLFSLIELYATNSIDLANTSESHDCGLGGGRAIAIHHIKLRHGNDFISEQPIGQEASFLR